MQFIKSHAPNIVYNIVSGAVVGILGWIGAAMLGFSPFQILLVVPLLFMAGILGTLGLVVIAGLVAWIRKSRLPQSVSSPSPSLQLHAIYIQSEIARITFRHIWDAKGEEGVLSPAPYLIIELKETHGSPHTMRITALKGEARIDGNPCGFDADLVSNTGQNGVGYFDVQVKQRITSEMAQIINSKIIKGEIMAFDLSPIILKTEITDSSGQTLTVDMHACDELFEVDGTGLTVGGSQVRVRPISLTQGGR